MVVSSVFWCLVLSAKFVWITIALELPPADVGITKRNFVRIERGTNRAQLHKLFGGIPRAFNVRNTPGGVIRSEVWQSRHQSFIVVSYMNDKVDEIHWVDSPLSLMR